MTEIVVASQGGMPQLWTPFDLLWSLVSLVTSSPAATKAERDAVASTLVSLRAGLAAALPDLPSASSGRSQFVNAASDLFCHQRVSEVGRQGQLDKVSTRVEAALAAIQGGRLGDEEAQALLLMIDSPVASLQ